MPPTAKRKLTPAKKIASRAETPPAAPATDMDRFRTMLARRIAMLISDHEECWRSCREPVCRRKRACAAPRMRCSNEPPAPPATPDQVARTLAAIQRALQKRMAQIEAEKE
jgi:hypothetical protein